MNVRGKAKLPMYWKLEKGGELVPAILQLMDGAELEARQIVVVSAYLRQWITSPVWDANPKLSADDVAQLGALRGATLTLRSTGDICRWIEKSVALGIDPL